MLKSLRKRKRQDEKEAREAEAKKPAATVKLDFATNEDSNRVGSSSEEEEDDSPSAKFRRGKQIMTTESNWCDPECVSIPRWRFTVGPRPGLQQWR